MAARRRQNAGRIRQMTRELGLDLYACVFPFGYADSLLWHDANLASGMPVKDAPLVARGGLLAPEQTANIRNGSFEEHRENQALYYSFQDDAGKSSFIDREIVKEGKVSLRFEDIGNVNQHGHGRISQEVKVKPWQQYRLRVWMKTEKLTASQCRYWCSLAAVRYSISTRWCSRPAGGAMPVRSARLPATGSSRA